MFFLSTAFLLGLAGSFHCVGMCGPIALALPLRKKETSRKLAGSLLYNAGRITTYSALGALFGFVGQGFVMAGFQQTISIGIGLLIIMGIVMPHFFSKNIKITSWIARAIAPVKKQMALLFKQHSLSASYFMGVLNGLLPCGLVYLGIAGAVALGQPINSLLYMTLFGAGTLPMMFLVSFFGNSLSPGIRTRMRKAVPIMMCMMGILLILRGMSLNIPYVSPILPNTSQSTEVTVCY